MYRRSKFIEILLEIRREMAGEADYDVDLFAEMVRSGSGSVRAGERKRLIVGRAARAAADEMPETAIEKDPIVK